MYTLDWYETEFVVGESGTQRQYVNLDKNEGSDCEPINHDIKLCLKVKCDPPNENYWVQLMYFDVPIIPQSNPAFPWVIPPGDPNPHNGDNCGSGAGFHSPYPVYINLQVPCDGIVEADFWTSTTGGDNYEISVSLWEIQPPPQGDTGKITEIYSPKIEVWRYLGVEIWAMQVKPSGLFDPPQPPDYYPDYSEVPPACAEGYVQTHIYAGYLTLPNKNLNNQWAILYEGHWGNLVYPEGMDLDYVDDFPYIQGAGQICSFEDKYELYDNPEFHPGGFDDCRSPAHTIQVLGFDKYDYEDPIGKCYGWPNNLGCHRHNFIAVGSIYRILREQSPPRTEEHPIAENKVFLHELGHRICKFLEDEYYDSENPHVMMQGITFDPIPLRYHPIHIYEMRAGADWFENDECDCFGCPPY